MTLYTDIDPYCCEVLAARVGDGSLPAGDVRCIDVKMLDARMLAPFHHVHLFCGIGASPLGLAWAGWPEHLSIVTGGFPCQDISAAGKGAGLDGSRSGLFWEMMRVVDCKRPDVVLAENVGALSARGLGRVVAALGSIGYDVGAFRVGAWVVGSPQERERWWIVAYRAGVGKVQLSARPGRPEQTAGNAAGSGAGGRVDAHGAMADGQRGGFGTRPGIAGDQAGAGRRGNQSTGGGEAGTLADTDGAGIRLAPASGRHEETTTPRGKSEGRAMANPHGGGRWIDQPGRESDRRDALGRPGPRRQLADVRGDGQGAVGLGGAAGTFADLASACVGVGDSERDRPEGHGHDAGQSQVAQPGHAGQPGRWPHVLWVDENGDPVPTPQYEWEPPRLFPGTRTINAAWRLALMGFPTGWLDLPDETLARLCPKYPRHPWKRANWANKQGVKATGNAQVPQCVELVMASFLDAIRGASK